MRIHRTTTFRLIVMLGLAFLCAMGALLALIYVLTERELVGRTDEVLVYQARAFASVPALRLPRSVRNAMRDDTSHLNHFALLDAQGRELVGDFMPRSGLRTSQFIEELPGPGEQRALRLLAQRTSDGGRLVIARDITQIADLRHRMLAILVASGLIATALLALAAVAMSAAPLRRVRTLTALAKRIASGELALRMPVSGQGDELDVIATTVNVMIEEIARLLDQVKGATDAIAHDLRSPLAHLRGQLEQMRGLGNDHKLPTAVDAAIDGLDTVLARFSALLRIAELKATNRQAGFADLDPMTLAAAVCELFEPLAEERGIDLVLSGAWGHIIRGDERLLFEVVSNLVDNAIKFIADGGRIAVGVSNDSGVTTIVVRDNGPGIAVHERASVLRRYYRGSAAQHVAGSGLGLSLVAEIVHLHGYALQLEDAHPGLEVQIICDDKTMK